LRKRSTPLRDWLPGLLPFLGIALVEFVGNQQQAADHLGPIGIGNAVDLGLTRYFIDRRILRPSLPSLVEQAAARIRARRTASPRIRPQPCA
jgi:hypothetical protein